LPSKENIQHFKTLNFLSRSNPDPDPDPDPKHWKKHDKRSNVRKIRERKRGWGNFERENEG
jgi:hypothetical protein